MRQRPHAALAALEVLHRALVLLRRRAACERPQVAALAGPRVFLTRIQPILAARQLADHGWAAARYGFRWPAVTSSLCAANAARTSFFSAAGTLKWSSERPSSAATSSNS